MMTADTPQPTEFGSRRFVIELLGFSDVEKAMFISTFRLTGRRQFSYAEASGPGARTDIYLVNADNAEALKELQARSPNVHAPAVLVGRTPVEVGWPQVDRPLHWMRLFEQMDETMHAALLKRAQRQAGTNENLHWDGRTYRRAGDHEATPHPAHHETKPTDTVLVVDDSATVRAFMRAKLAPFHFDVDYAENGETAIDMAQAKAYTCIFLDIMMPGIDGYQVCKRIKGSPSTKDTAVIMLSSKSSTFDKIRGSWAGCDAYLGKPVGEDELLTTIARFLPGARKVADS
jgi:twitching motility two-component system response regulator PilG